MQIIPPEWLWLIWSIGCTMRIHILPLKVHRVTCIHVVVSTHQCIGNCIKSHISLAQLCIWGCFIGPPINMSLNISLKIYLWIYMWPNSAFEATLLGHSRAPQGKLWLILFLHAFLPCFVFVIFHVFCEYGFCICKMYRIIFALCIALYLGCFWYWMCTVHSIVFVYCIVFGHPDLRQFPPILFDFLHSRRRCIACPYTLR